MFEAVRKSPSNVPCFIVAIDGSIINTSLELTLYVYYVIVSISKVYS